MIYKEEETPDEKTGRYISNIAAACIVIAMICGLASAIVNALGTAPCQ